MRTDWLKRFIFDTKLFDNVSLSYKEIISPEAYIKDKKTYEEIGNQIGVSDERVRQLIENGLGKIFLAVKDILARSQLLRASLTEKQFLEYQLTQLKTKFKKELKEEQLASVRVKPLQIPISDISLSVRAKKILKELNIIYISDMTKLSRQILYSVDRAGVKTVEEIIRISEEYGVKID
jgi:hypothetical protein